MSRPLDTSSLKKFASVLRTLPTVLAQNAATKAAPTLSKIVETSFAAGEDPYGIQWAPGVDGQRVTLRKSGDLAKRLFYVAIGRILRLRLGVPYAKYQVGRRRVAPAQGAPLPPEYAKALKAATQEAAREYLQR